MSKSEYSVIKGDVIKMFQYITFVREGPTLTVFFLYFSFNGVLLVGQWWPFQSPTMNAGLVAL